MPNNCGCGTNCTTACVSACHTACGSSCEGKDAVSPVSKPNPSIKIPTIKKSVIGDTIIERMRVKK